MKPKVISVFYAFSIVVAACMVIAISATDSKSESADALFQAQKWEEAAAAYEKLTRERPSDGQSWFRLGYAHHRLEHDAEALAAYEQARRHGIETVRLLATAAVSHERLGQHDAAMERLGEAVEQGLPPSALEQNPSFAFARGDVRYAALVARAEELAFPCRNDPKSRQFDFWIGDWDVSAGGTTAGRNVITSRHEGCLIFESYTTERGYSGQSFNFYDPSIEKWRQIWLDSGGGVIWYEGNLVDGEMRFEGDAYQRNGPKVRSRMTFTPNADGSVRQRIERSTDGGKTWTAGFDGHYVRKD